MKIGVELRPGRVGKWSVVSANEKKEKRKKRKFSDGAVAPETAV
jgi:hypothetical protein